jgi:integrase
MWVFQTRVPHSFLTKYPDTAPVFRRSTRTRDKRAALKIARRWLIQLEDSWESAMNGHGGDDQGGVLTLKTDEVFGFGGGDELDDLTKTIQERAKKHRGQREAAVRLDDVLNKWIATKKKASTAEAYGDSGRLFVRFMADIGIDNVNGVTHDAMRQFRDALPEIPASFTKKFGKDARIPEILGKAPPWATRTIKKHVEFIANFMRWSLKDAYGFSQEHIDILTNLPNLDEHPQSANEGRGSYTDEEANRVFSHPGFLSLSPSMQWAIRIASLTGARQGEILQLTKDDIRQEQGYWIFDINRKDGKSTKNESSIRQVVVADCLWKAGMQGWIDSVNQHRLFPDEPMLKGHFRNFAGRYRTFKKGIGLRHEVKFHSWRNYLKDRLQDIGCPREINHLISGHNFGKRTVGDGYIKSFSLAQQARWVNKLPCLFRPEDDDLEPGGQ